MTLPLVMCHPGHRPLSPESTLSVSSTGQGDSGALRTADNRFCVPLTSIDPATPSVTAFPNFRGISSSAQTLLPTIFSPQDSVSSLLEELLDSPAGSHETESINDGALSSSKVAHQKSVNRAKEMRYAKEGQHLPTLNGDCPVCHGICSACTVSDKCSGSQQDRMFRAAHHAQELERKAGGDILRKWISRLNFAKYAQELDNEEGEVSLFTWETFRSHTEDDHIFRRPAIIKEDFADSQEWSQSRYADLLELAFEGTQWLTDRFLQGKGSGEKNGRTEACR